MRKGHGFRGSAPWGDIWGQGGRSFRVASAKDSDVRGWRRGGRGARQCRLTGW